MNVQKNKKKKKKNKKRYYVWWYVYNSCSWREITSVDDTVSDDRIINNHIIGFKETQINRSDSTCKITAIFNFYNVKFNDNENKLFNLA